MSDDSKFKNEMLSMFSRITNNDPKAQEAGKDCIDGNDIVEEYLVTFSRHFEAEKAYVKLLGMTETRSWFADQDALKFELKDNGKVAFESELQILGTYNASEERFFWAWNNTSIKEAAYKQIRDQIAKIGDISELTEERSFSCYTDCILFANAIALDLGYDACFIGSVSDEANIFIPVCLKPVSAYVPSAVCCGCYGTKENCDQIAEINNGFGMCRNCTESVIIPTVDDQIERWSSTYDIDEGKPRSANLQNIVQRIIAERRPVNEMPAKKPFCIFCERITPSVPSIAARWNHICFSCIPEILRKFES